MTGKGSGRSFGYVLRTALRMTVLWGVGERRAGALEVVGEAGAGEVGFYFGEDGGAEVDGVGELADGAGEGEEDAVDLGLLFVEEADELVVLLDGFEGFHKYSLSR